MEFRTILDRQKIESNPGERFAPTYSMKFQEDGTKDLVETGKVDVYAKIQSYKDSCDINVILERFVNGDESVLNVNTPSFGDFTEYPTTYAEMLQRTHDAEEMFMQLPVEVRAEFNHSPGEFFASIGSEKFTKVYDKHFKVEPDVSVEPVVPSQPVEPVVNPGGDVNVQKPE